MCTGAREKNGNKPFWLVAYSHFKQGREPRSKGCRIYDSGITFQEVYCEACKVLQLCSLGLGGLGLVIYDLGN
jgi:hypothetical protein